MELSRVKLAGIAVGAVVAILVLAYLFGVIGAPSVESMDNQWGDVDDERIEIETELEVHNPNPVGLSHGIDSANYSLALNGIHVADGETGELDVGSGTSTIDLRTDLYHHEIPAWWATHIDNDEVSDVDVEATVHASIGPFDRSPSISHADEIETDLETTLSDAAAAFEGEHEGPAIGIEPFTIQPTVDITDADAEWGTVTESHTQIRLHFDVHNPNAYPIPTPAFTGNMTFNEILVGDWDAHDVEVLQGTYDTAIPPGATRELTLGVDLDNDRVAEWFASHVDADEQSHAEIRGQLAFSINDHVMTMPPDDDAFSCSLTFQTNIFVDQESGVIEEHCETVGYDTSIASDLAAVGAWLDLTETDEYEEAEEEGEEDDENGDDNGIGLPGV